MTTHCVMPPSALRSGTTIGDEAAAKLRELCQICTTFIPPG